MRVDVKEPCLRAGSIIVLLVLWWASAKLMNDPQVLPGPVAIARTIVKDFGMPGPEGESAYFDVGITLARIFHSFCCGDGRRNRHWSCDGAEPSV